MDAVSIENFRCFRERQTARLAPLTLLVGENSTGKTSLMAMVRILWSTVYRGEIRPDFKAETYDLGSFREIVHQASNDGSPAEFFVAQLGIGEWKSEVTFGQGKNSTEVYKLHAENAHASLTWDRSWDGHIKLHASTERGSWQFDTDAAEDQELGIARRPFSESWGLFSLPEFLKRGPIPAPDMLPITADDIATLRELVMTPYRELMIMTEHGEKVPVLTDATAPVRSRPLRTYNPGFVVHDPEGSSVPAYLASLAQSDPQEWNRLKRSIDLYGQQTGVFDELKILLRGDSSAPFHVLVRKHAEGDEGSWRNLVDVGYGVSQILPVFSEFVRPEASFMLQLQQPEVHLHPSAQAGLGSILCNVAASGKLLLVETHSDHLIDRVRMDVRDSKTDLKADDVSILFFERQGEEAEIHSIGIDNEGNILNAPSSYRKFFMEEVNRSLGL